MHRPGPPCRRTPRQLASLVALIAALAAADPAIGLTSYHVGNSLTWDARPTYFDELSAARGLTHTAGHHIRCGKDLPYIVAHPDETCVTPTAFGKWDAALPNHAWDVVTMQVHYGGTLATDAAAAAALIDAARSNPANQTTRFILYGPWPRLNADADDDYDPDLWLAPIDASDGATPTTHRRAYFQAVYDRVTALRPDASVELLLTGELIYQANQRIAAATGRGGDWLGYTATEQLYRDVIHMDLDGGRWLATLAMWSAITGQDPTALPPASYWGPTSPIVTDPAWRDRLSTFVASQMPRITAVPEPGSLLLLAAGAPAVARRRKRTRRRRRGVPVVAAMAGCVLLTALPAAAIAGSVTVAGDTQADILAAIQQAGVGGTVNFQPTTYLITDTLRPLTSQTWLGNGATLRRAAPTRGALTQAANAGDAVIYVSNPADWSVGQRVTPVRTADRTRSGMETNPQLITAINGNAVSLKRPITKSYGADDLLVGAYTMIIIPSSGAITIEGFRFDGNRDEQVFTSWSTNQAIYTGANTIVRGNEFFNLPGDAILARGPGQLIEDNLVHDTDTSVVHFTSTFGGADSIIRRNVSWNTNGRATEAQHSEGVFTISYRNDNIRLIDNIAVRSNGSSFIGDFHGQMGGWTVEGNVAYEVDGLFQGKDTHGDEPLEGLTFDSNLLINSGRGVLDILAAVEGPVAYTNNVHVNTPEPVFVDIADLTVEGNRYLTSDAFDSIFATVDIPAWRSIDADSVLHSVPEPGSLLLLAAGAPAVARRRRSCAVTRSASLRR